MKKSSRSILKLFNMLMMSVVILGLANSAVLAEQLRLVGSGASFPYPIYSTWFKTFSKDNKDILVDYQSKGSGAGIKDFLNNTVDFAASDAAMKKEEMDQVKDGVQLLPMTAGTIVLAYNIPGVPAGLKLSREAYSKIFLAKSKNGTTRLSSKTILTSSFPIWISPWSAGPTAAAQPTSSPSISAPSAKPGKRGRDTAPP